MAAIYQIFGMKGQEYDCEIDNAAKIEKVNIRKPQISGITKRNPSLDIPPSIPAAKEGLGL